MYKKELSQRAIRIWKKVVVFMLLSGRLLWSKGTGGVFQCLKALWPEYIKPVVTRWSETSCLAHKPRSKPGFLPAAACGLPWRIHAEDCVWFCAWAPKERVQMGVLPWRNAYQIFRVCISSLFDSSRSIGKVSRARSKNGVCVAAVCNGTS